MTTTTLSREQRELALERVRAAGLEDRVTVLLRRLPRADAARYDKLVSIEMIEAVGWKDFGTFFDALRGAAAPDGVMALQAITIDDRALRRREGPAVVHELADLPERLPAVGRGDRAQRRPPQRLADGRPRGHHAALRRDAAPLARERRGARGRGCAQLGYDERFQRLWRLYLRFCEAGFTERRIGERADRARQAALARAPGHRRSARDAGRHVGGGAHEARCSGVLGFRVAYGAGLLLAPDKITKSWLGPLDDASRVALRALGTREIGLHGSPSPRS